MTTKVRGIAANAITSSMLKDGSVDSDAISSLAVTTPKIGSAAVTSAQLNESNMRDKYFVETWGLTVNHNDDTVDIGSGETAPWALSTEYNSTHHASFTNSQRMMTPGHGSSGDTMPAGSTVTGKEYFQFPETGIYSIRPMFVVYGDGVDGTVYTQIFINDLSIARFYNSVAGTNHYSNTFGELIVKITNHVTDTVSFRFSSISPNDYVQGQASTSTMYESHVIFRRLGDLVS